MRVVHCGFDTLHVAVRASITHEFAKVLDHAKEQAEANGQSVRIEYQGVSLMISGHGGNGYRYLANGGVDGAQWAFKKPNPRDKWGIRVVFGSSFMADYGLGGARAHVHRALEKLGNRIAPSDISVGRLDFCVDVLAPRFTLQPENFVMHSHANRADHIEADRRIHGKSGRTTSVTIGKMPGRQVIVYDKRAEVIERKKREWWVRWNAALAREGLAPLDPSDADASRIWRFEVRAGKRLLKDRWAITTWAGLDEKLGDVLADCLHRIRYTEPDPTDTNRARWPQHPIWSVVQDAINTDLFEMTSGANPDQIKEVRLEEHMAQLKANAFGTLTTLCAAHGQTYDALPGFMNSIGHEFGIMAERDPEGVSRKLAAARDRYHFI